MPDLKYLIGDIRRGEAVELLNLELRTDFKEGTTVIFKFMMPRSFLVKQQEKPADTEKEPTSSQQDQKTSSQNGLGSPPPLLKISPRHSPSLQRTPIATDNSRPIPRLVKIGDPVPTAKPLKEDFHTRNKLEEQRGLNESLSSKIDLRMRHRLSMLSLPPKDLWLSHGPDSRTSLHSSYIDDYRRQMRYKNEGFDVRPMFEPPNFYPREQDRFYPHQQKANHIEGKQFAGSSFAGKPSEGTYYRAHGTMIGAKGGIYPNLPLYSNVAFHGSKENETSSQARPLPRYFLPHFYPNFSEHDHNKDFRKPDSYVEIKAREEPKPSPQEDAMIESDVMTSTADVNIQDSEYDQSGASVGNDDETVPKASTNGEDHGTKTQASIAKKYRYTCDVCGKSFSRSNTLTTHKRIHTGDKPFHCEQCGRAFRQPGNLTRHRLTHTAVKPYVCPQCNKAFNRASNLHTHMRTHTNYKPFVCDFCGKGFHQKIDMKIHRYTHTGEKPHKCTKCGRGFKQLTHLTYHMRTHSDERLYKCEYCGKGFNQKGNLQAHIYGHTGERPFKCDICDKGFTLASTLNTHKRTHAMKKPFECQFCGKAFYQKNALKTHYIASHPFANGVSLL